MNNPKTQSKLSFSGKAFFLAPILLAAACAATRPDIIQVGPWFTAKSSGEVQLFSTKEETTRPWGGIAIIHSERFPADDKAGLAVQKKIARKMAAEIGADGLIISEQTDMGTAQFGGFREPETFISALAIKYVTNISTAGAADKAGTP